MFSKALREMDRNTELLMWDEMTNELEQLKTELKEAKAEQQSTKAEYETELNNTKAGYENELSRLRETIKQLQKEIQQNK